MWLKIEKEHKELLFSGNTFVYSTHFFRASSAILCSPYIYIYDLDIVANCAPAPLSFLFTEDRADIIFVSIIRHDVLVETTTDRLL